jgi:hypothetical protein
MLAADARHALKTAANGEGLAVKLKAYDLLGDGISTFESFRKVANSGEVSEAILTVSSALHPL